jgi:tetratricopeptide (TPR) repeat protein
MLANAGGSRERSERSPARADLLLRLTPALLAAVVATQVALLAPAAYFGERARVALRDFRGYEALAAAQQALRTDDSDPQLLYILGRARLLIGDTFADRRARDSFYRAAAGDFMHARELAPLDETYPIEAGLTFDGLGRFAEAEWMFEEALQLDPRSNSAREYYHGHLERWRNGGDVQVPEDG